MTTITFPVELGTPLLSGWSEKEPDVIIRTEMEQGPAKTRRWGTAGVGEMTVAFSWDKTQRDLWKTFFRNSIASGALSFNFTHPVDKNTLSVRLKEVPTETLASFDRYSYNLTLEILP